MSGMQGTKRADEYDGVGGGGGGGGGGLFVIAAVQKVFHFMEGPADVLSASTACRRWRELACAGSVWRVKAEREGILDKAKAFEIEVPPVPEGDLLEAEETVAMAFYARVFVLKVRGRSRDGACVSEVSVSPPLPTHTHRRCLAGVHDAGRGP